MTINPIIPDKFPSLMRSPLGRPLRRWIAAGAAAAVAAACFVGPARALQPANTPDADQADQKADQKASGGERFLRFRKVPAAQGGGGVLETSIVTYENADGVKVDLIGAVHVGDSVYYDLLNERFATYDSLLYEMVKPKGTEVADRAQARADGEVPLGMQLIGTLQQAMQMALELDFQVEAIDYAASNFVHADLDMETFLQLQAERGEGFLQMILQQMLNDLTRPPADDGYQPPTMLEIMAALNAPDRARQLKLLFARELARMDDLTAMMDPGGDGSVILDERNKKAVEVLDARIAAGDRNLGVFYGAAHLKGIEQMLKERGFEQVGEPDYLIAWDMTPDGSGRREMRERMRNTIVRNAVGEAVEAEGGEAGEGGGVAAAGADAGENLLAAMKSELDALRRENEALRRQVEALRSQNDAMRRRLEEQAADEQ